MSSETIPMAHLVVLERIARHLYLNADYVKDFSLLNGSSGIALFFYYYSRILNDQFYADYADELFDSIYSDLPHPDNFDHATGICGIAVFIQHLISNDFITAGDDDVLSVVDESIANAYKCYCKSVSSAADHPFSIAAYYVNRWEKNNGFPDFIFPYVNNLVNDLYQHVAVEYSREPADLWQTMITSVLQDDGMHMALMNASTVICLQRLKKILPANPLLDSTIGMIREHQEKMLNWLNHYWENNSKQIARSEDYYWVEYFLILLRYAKLAARDFIDGDKVPDQALSDSVREGFMRIVSNEKALTGFHGHFLQGDPLLILIGNAMHRYTQDDRYAIYTEHLLNKFLEPHPFTIGGSSLMNPGATFLSISRGHAGTGLLLLAFNSSKSIPWEGLLGHYDISASLSEEIKVQS